MRRPRGVDAPLPPIVPAPAPLFDAPPPPLRESFRKGGVPLVAVALTAGGIVLAGGVAIATLVHRASTGSRGIARVTPEGTDVLHLTCDPASCADGTVAQFDGASATLRGRRRANLPARATAATSAITRSRSRIDRPGLGRDELVSLVVPVGYRVRADVSPMNGTHPSILIHVEALSGSDVRVDGKPVALDASGNGSYTISTRRSRPRGPPTTSRVVSLDIRTRWRSASHPTGSPPTPGR